MSFENTNPAQESKPPMHSSQAITFWLIALNFLVFAITAATGVGFFEPTPQSLLTWGANYGPLTLNGQWWRLFTSLFLHFGIFHVFFNMCVLLNIGMFMEGVLGSTPYTLLYILAGLGGSVASLAWHPSLVSAGASGAVFGLYGGLLAYVLRSRGKLPNKSLKPLFKGAAMFIGWNLAYGLLKPEIDLAAHVGGLGAGFFAGLLLIQPDAETNPDGNSRKYAGTALCWAAALVAVLVVLPKPDDLPGEIERMAAMEEKILTLFNESVTDWYAQRITDEQFAETLERRVLPPWNVEEKSIEKLKHLSSKQMRIAASLGTYMRTRNDGWLLLLNGVRTNDVNKINQSQTKSQEADALAKTISRSARTN